MTYKRLKESKIIKKITKLPSYSRLRQYFPMPGMQILDDRGHLPEAEEILIDWPQGRAKPYVGVMRDYEPYPRWTKYCRFLENNAFPYDFYDLHSSKWLEEAEKFDVFVGILSNQYCHLQEMRKKYFILEKFLGKFCFPSFEHIFLYEDKTLESYISLITGIPFAPTHIYNNYFDALHAVETLHFPLVNKIDPGSGSVGVEWVHNKKQACHIIEAAFSRAGRATHSLYFRQKEYVYFQDFIPNDGYDIRVEVVNNWAFGYYRKVLSGDFRASGMNMVEKRALPKEAIRIAWKVNQIIKSPLLVVDLVHGKDDKYYVIEFSPVCQMELPEQLHVNGVPGVYIISDDGTIQFREGKYWVHELSLREFLLNSYLPNKDE